jgi:hypothetical protein
MNFIKQLPSSLNWLIPTDVELIRVGDNTDGGYLIPKVALDQANALLSLGLGENWTFDEHWHNLHPEDPIHIYDGTLTKESFAKAWPNGPLPGFNRPEPFDPVKMYEEFWNSKDNLRHYVEMMGNKRGQTNLKTCLDRLHSDNVFVKMDIEGGEYSLISEFIEHKDRIVGIAAEFHDLVTSPKQFAQAYFQLREHFELVHLHGNITFQAGPEGLTDGIELTFLRKDLCDSTEKRYKIYHELDRSNVLNFYDFEYWFEEPNIK